MKKILLILILLIISLLILLMIVDYIRFNKNEYKPLICIYSKGEDYKAITYYGIGYSFYKEEIDTGFIDLYLPPIRIFKLFYFIPIKEI